VRVSGATPDARPLPDPVLAVEPRGAEPRGVDPRGVDLRRVDPRDADPREVAPRDAAPRDVDGLRRDPGLLAGGFRTCGGAGGVLVVAVFAWGALTWGALTWGALTWGALTWGGWGWAGAPGAGSGGGAPAERFWVMKPACAPGARRGNR
jgi:hypothetical protein